MTQPDRALCTPIRIKDRPALAFPGEEAASYVLASNGLFLRRRHEFFTSCVPARDWPRELHPHRESFEPRFPKLRRVLFERIVGFFDAVRERDGAEAAVLLAWDRERRRVVPLVPAQKATMGRSWGGGTYPIGLDYDRPLTLPAGWFVFGDIHCHVDAAAYASGTDRHDESYQAGLHIVVGRLYQEPAEVHVEAVVDGVRFPLTLDDVLDEYRARRTDFPAEWLDEVEVEVEKPWTPPTGGSYSAYSSPYYGASPHYPAAGSSSYGAGKWYGGGRDHGAGGNGRARDDREADR